MLDRRHILFIWSEIYLRNFFREKLYRFRALPNRIIVPQFGRKRPEKPSLVLSPGWIPFETARNGIRTQFSDNSPITLPSIGIPFTEFNLGLPRNAHKLEVDVLLETIIRLNNVLQSRSASIHWVKFQRAAVGEQIDKQMPILIKVIR